MKTIVLVAFDNFTDIDLFLPWDLFNRVRIRDKEWTVKIVGTAPRKVHSMTCGEALYQRF